MITRHVAALEQIRKLSPYRDITNPVAWQQETLCMNSDEQLALRMGGD